MTLQLPHVPPIVKGFRFEGVQEHQLRQTLATEIRQTIEVLIKSTYVPSWQGVFYKFRDCIEPGRMQDLARLPYPTNGPNSTAATKIGVVYARLSWCIQLYWAQCLEGAGNTERLRNYLDDLRQWATVGIEKCEIKGNPKDGYWLGVPNK